ncbi:MAG TPA: SRPBCC family protein [Desulfuromonadaceae bacterium]|jgi:ligand-binding SRPBCC domain-containing protein
MPEHTLKFNLTLALPRQTIFDFFADAANLGAITPPELDFAILSSLPITMGPGAIISYRLKLFGFPFNWKSKITAWAPPDYFIDEQVEGPYRQWIHRHTFSDGPNNSTVIDDEVRFRLPIAPLGEAAYPMVRKQLERIFLYRQETIKSLLLKSKLP